MVNTGLARRGDARGGLCASAGEPQRDRTVKPRRYEQKVSNTGELTGMRWMASENGLLEDETQKRRSKARKTKRPKTEDTYAYMLEVGANADKVTAPG